MLHIQAYFGSVDLDKSKGTCYKHKLETIPFFKKIIIFLLLPFNFTWVSEAPVVHLGTLGCIYARNCLLYLKEIMHMPEAQVIVWLCGA